MNPAAILPLFLMACTQGVSHGSASTDAQAPTRPTGDTMDARIWVVQQARNGDYWFGSNGNGVYRHDGTHTTHYRTADGLLGSQVRRIEEHPNGNLLVSTTKGVSRFDGRRFVPLQRAVPSHPDNGWRLAPDDVWLVSDAGSYGVLRYDGERLFHLKLPKSPWEDAFRQRHADAPGFWSPADIYSIYRDRRGHLWFGTAGLGLCRYDGESFRWMYDEHLTTTPRGGAFGIRSIYEDRSGDFWICNTRHRFTVEPAALQPVGSNRLAYGNKPGLPDADSDDGANFAFYPSIIEDGAGALWIACGDEVLRFDGKQVSRHEVTPGAYTATMLCDRAGKIWIGTIEHGVYVFDGKRFRRFVP